MRIKIFTPNNNGKIEFTKEELEKLLEEAYQEGYDEGSKKTILQYPQGIRGISDIVYTNSTGTGGDPY